MTNQQKEVLNSIKAACADLTYNELPMGSFKTESIQVLLEILEIQSWQLSCIRQDLKDMNSVVDSSLRFLDAK